MNKVGKEGKKGNKASRYLLIGVLFLFGATVINTLSHREEKILLATGRMFDRIFMKTVLIVGGNWVTGWSGVIINKPLNEAEKVELPESIRNLNREIGFGGPVGFPDTYYVLERHENKTTGTVRHVLREWNAAVRDRPDLPDLIRQDTTTPYRYRIFAGFSSWAPLQLENEFTMLNGWEDMAVDLDLIWNPGTDASWEAIQSRNLEKRLKLSRQAL
ncbi:MAG: YqgE/AlgH family protein [Alphaproteobacteria bacterium]